jgi:hypothetical protein
MDRIKIAYQNKDITSKALAENFKGKTFKVYGLDIPDIVRALPTNLPVIQANELRLDNLFELADGTAAIVDYESEYSEKDKIKYLNYITGTANRYVKAKRDCPILRMIVIYTGDIKREQIVEEYHIGAISLKIETACLSELNAQEILTRLKEKVERKEQLTDEELMEFIILPLSYHKIEEKEEKIKETVELATKIADRQQQIFTLAGIAVFTDKIIDKETAGKIRRMIEMTQIAQIFEEEKQQAAESYETEKRQALQQAAESYETEKRQTAESYEIEKRQMVIKMLKRNYPVEEIISLMPGYSQKDVEKLRKSLLK